MKSSSVFANELRAFLHAGAITILGLEVFLTLWEGAADFPRASFAAAAGLFYLLFTVLEYVFVMIAKGRGSYPGLGHAFWLLPAAVLFLALRGRPVLEYADEAVLAAAAARAGLVIISGREKVSRRGIYVLDVAALVLFLGMDALSGAFLTDKVLFICLTVLTLDSVQRILYERGRGAFPFWYYGALAAILMTLPMGREPIEWTQVIEAGQALAGRVMDAADSLSYYFSTVFDIDSLEAGYSSFDMTGELVRRSEKTELVLRTSSFPYTFFTDEETGRRMKVRRALRLVGGQGVEGDQLVRFLWFLHSHGVDRKDAALFSQLSHVEVEYAYLDTYDEIAPAGSLTVTAGDTRIEGGTGGKRHRKGYSLKAAYLDIDYGSPYLVDLLRQKAFSLTSENSDNTEESSQTGESGEAMEAAMSGDSDGSAFFVPDPMNYGELCDYVRELYGLDFRHVMSEREYARTAGGVSGMLDPGLGDSPRQESAAPGSDQESYGLYEPAALPADPGAAGAQADGRSYLDTAGASGRMADLAAELTAPLACTYDKCKAVEAYLRQYSYSRNATGGKNSHSDMTSAGGMADIADRFLFETGEGYCVHYTSAMVILLRLSGIPARAVSGYRYDFPFEKQETYPVSSECAHTWPEAFLPGIGWVPFEPTASVGTAAQYSWHRRRAGEAGGEADQEPARIPAPLPAADPGALAEGEAPEEGLLPQAFSIAGPVILSILLLALFLLAGTRLLGFIRYRRSSPAQRLKADVEAILQLLRRQAARPIPDRGLLSDYLEAVPEDLREDMRIIFRTYYRVVYGNEATPSCDPQVSEKAKALREDLRRHPVDRTGRTHIRQFFSGHLNRRKVD